MYKAVVFDLDGTLVQTEQLKAASYAEAAHELDPGIDPSEVDNAYKAVVGRSRHEAASTLLAHFHLEAAAGRRMGDFGVATPWQAFVQVRLAIYQKWITDAGTIRRHRWPYNVELVDMAERAGCRLALATMSHCDQTRTILTALDMEGVFEFVATRDDVDRPKPDPEIYLLARHHLGIPAEETLVLEDSLPGVESALAAGLSVVAVTTPFTKESIHQSHMLPPDRVIDNHAAVIPLFDQLLKEVP